ncbi:low specificity L-threonine aldolase [Hansschlegelia quercus]|uniref:L-threonine aldolase n=1 Tax=Hansschlegelia quercus TaxID=2528245 RepID=A0A4V2JEI1_9HYPH|nr:beta-eliminating lyase-related protein [Hansschlegelia quercus]TBN55356.1 low specificity L-threonine aldolase [Hansschlegelia quercus]
MNLASDNIAPAHPAVIEALARVNEGAATPYGKDETTARVEALLAEIFEHEVGVFLVTTGTAANALALAQMTPPWGAALAHHEAHVMHDECGAPEFFTNGAKMVGVAGADGRIDAGALADILAKNFWTPPTHVRPASLTLSQATEAGTVYRADQITELFGIAREHGMRVHMDGARFANAVVSTRETPAALTWKAGVDALSLGFTKNGAMAAEAIVLFAPELIEGLAERRKRGGHLWSKSRFIAAQALGLLENGLWLELAARANAQAARLTLGVAARGLDLAFPVEANEVFVWLPAEIHQGLQDRGAHYYVWESDCVTPARGGRPREVMARLICSWATPNEDVDAFLSAIDGAAPAKRASRSPGTPLF